MRAYRLRTGYEYDFIELVSSQFKKFQCGMIQNDSQNKILHLFINKHIKANLTSIENSWKKRQMINDCNTGLKGNRPKLTITN